MLPIKTIVCPTDFSATSEAAAQVAGALARDYRAKLLLLHVRELPTMAFGEFGALPPEPMEAEEELRPKLAALGARLAVPVECVLAQGQPTAEILGLAQTSHADLIVLGTHGRTGLGRLLLGSVAEQVVRKAPCLVLTVKAPSAQTAAVAAVEPASAKA